MTTSFDFPNPDHFVAGAIGPAGQRIFYLQVGEGGQIASLRLEKQQVSALSDYLTGILADLPVAEPLAAEPTLIEPVIAEWVVGALAVAYEEADDRILLVAEELVVEDEDAPEWADAPDTATARFRLTRSQVASFVAQAAALVTSGRPLCRLCGRPIDPEGHACPRLN